METQKPIETVLKNAFDKHCRLPIGFWREIAGQGSIISADKEHCLKKPFQTENFLYFILEGSAGILLWNKKNYICTDIVLRGDFLCDYFSFITRQATPYEVITFEKAELFKISHTSLSATANRSEYGEKFWRFAAEALYIDKHLQFIQAATRTAGEIYRLMMQYEPSLIRDIPQKYLASFLGITPQSLSRIRNSTTPKKLS